MVKICSNGNSRKIRIGDSIKEAELDLKEDERLACQCKIIADEEVHLLPLK